MIQWVPSTTTATEVAKLADNSELHLVIGESGVCSLYQICGGIEAVVVGDEASLRAQAERVAQQAAALLNWREGKRTQSTRTEIGSTIVLPGIEYHVVIGESFATLVKVEASGNQALACGTAHEMRDVADTDAERERAAQTQQDDSATAETSTPDATAAAELLAELPSSESIATSVDGIIKT